MPRSTSSMIMIIAMLSLIILSTFAIALADPDPANNQSDFSIKHSTKALQFQLGSAFSRRYDESLTLAYKYYLSPKSALRLGIGLTGNFESTDTQSQYYSYTDSTILDRKANSDDDSHSINVTLQYLKIHQISSKLNFILGYGPYFGFSRSHGNEKQILGVDDWVTYNTTYYYIMPGINCTFGAEWFISQRISLSADYGIALSYIHRTQKETRDDNDAQPPLHYKTTTNRVGWNSMATNIGVSVYF